MSRLVDEGTRLRFFSGWLFLLVGLSALGLAIGLEVVQHSSQSTDEVNKKLGKYTAALSEVRKQSPRYEVSFVEVSLNDFQSLTAPDGGGGSSPYEVAETDVAKRIRTGVPSLHPDFGVFPHGEESLLAEAFSQGRARETEVSVVALLISQTTSGRLQMRLDTRRLHLNGFEGVFDPLDLVFQVGSKKPLLETEYQGSQDSVSIRVKPNYQTQGTFVPLALLHVVKFPRTPANADLLEATGGLSGWQVTTNEVLLPRKLYVRRDGSGEARVAIQDILSTPLLFDEITPR